MCLSLAGLKRLKYLLSVPVQKKTNLANFALAGCLRSLICYLESYFVASEKCLPSYLRFREMNIVLSVYPNSQSSEIWKHYLL